MSVIAGKFDQQAAGAEVSYDPNLTEKSYKKLAKDTLAVLQDLQTDLAALPEGSLLRIKWTNVIADTRATIGNMDNALEANDAAHQADIARRVVSLQKSVRQLEEMVSPTPQPGRILKIA